MGRKELVKYISILFWFICIYRPILPRPAYPTNHELIIGEGQADQNSLGNGTKEKATLALPQNGDLFEGDIVMDNRLRRAINGRIAKKSFIPGMANLGFLWPNGLITYEIAPDFPQNQRDMLHEMIREFHNRTCIRFKRRDPNDPRSEFSNYVYYTSKRRECSSRIGMIGGRQNIHLGEHCGLLGTYEHETMHALGFVHEHSRPDRDDYIQVIYRNIRPKQLSNFRKYSMFGILGVESTGLFDFASIMMYSNDAFSKNGKDTIKSIAEPDLKFGQRMKFSSGDVKQINELYNCRWHLKHPNYHHLFKAYHTKRKRRRWIENMMWRRFFFLK